MSPNRSEPSLLSPKPYTRPDTSPRLASMDGGLLSDFTQDKPGFPTYAQYKAIETCYLDSLSPKRQSKALISQAMYDRIWDVLTRPSECGETAQFRYWVRKMFKFGRSSDYAWGSNPEALAEAALIHDNALVAVQEKIYYFLCHFHGITNHGGRDKTCNLVRRHYSWVPKDLIAQFVKICPTCRLKRRVRGESYPTLGLTSSAPPSPTLPLVHDSGTSSEPSSPAPDSTAPFGFSFHERGICHNLSLSHVDSKLQSTTTQPAVEGAPTGLGFRGFPMTREVSLYLGLPNGWQFYTDYATAREACIEMKKLQAGQNEFSKTRPRIPSIAPMSPPTIQELMDTYLVAEQDTPAEEHYLGCIDPALLSLSDSSQGSEEGSYDGVQDFTLDTMNNSGTIGRSLYTLKNIDISEAFDGLVYPDTLTPDLIESTYVTDYDSPMATELPTPEDESIRELGGELKPSTCPQQGENMNDII